MADVLEFPTYEELKIEALKSSRMTGYNRVQAETGTQSVLVVALKIPAKLTPEDEAAILKKLVDIIAPIRLEKITRLVSEDFAGYTNTIAVQCQVVPEAIANESLVEPQVVEL